MIFIIFFTLLSLTLSVSADEELDCYHLTSENFRQELQASPHSFIFFYDPKCSHSKKYIPFWNQLSQKFKTIDKLNVACVNCKKQKGLCSEMNIYGFPTLNLYNGLKFFDEYGFERDFEQLSAWADCWSESDPNKKVKCSKLEQKFDRIMEEKERAKLERKALKAAMKKS